MNISKLNLGKFAAANQPQPENHISAPKNFSYFAKKEIKEEPEFTKTDLSSKVHDAHEKGMQEGMEKGKHEVLQTAMQVEQSTKNAVEQMIMNLSNFLSEYDEFKKQYMRDMARITIMAIQKIAARSIKENAEEVILQALEKSASVFLEQPEIIFKAKKIVLEKIQDKVDNILKTQEFKGKVKFVADDTVNDGNCVIEWGDSGISINGDESLKKIEEIISEYLKSI